MAEDAPISPPSPAASPRAAPRKIIKWSVAALILIAIIVAAAYYWRQSEALRQHRQRLHQRGPHRNGGVGSGPGHARVWMRDQQTVRAGEVLFEIDPQPWQLAVDAAEAQLEMAYQGSTQEKAAVEAARAMVIQRTAGIQRAFQREARPRPHRAEADLRAECGDRRDAGAHGEAAVTAAQANLQQALGALGQAGARMPPCAPPPRNSRRRNSISRTRVVAPGGGLLANFDIRPGTMVQAGVPIFTIIDDREFWVDANFKETDLRRIQPGQKATIEVDMYRGHEFHGEVQSLSGGAGRAFSLLPAQNATGNWVKVTQRVPVRVRVLDPDAKLPLRIGTTANVRIAAPD